MTKYNFFNHLNEGNKEYIEQVIGLAETVIKKSEEIKEHKMNTYLCLLDEVSQMLENERLQITRRKVNDAEDCGCDEEERSKIVMTILKECEELNSYIDELKGKLKKMVNRGLIQNTEFRQKNLRGAKVEDLYFKISQMINESIIENDFDPLNGLISGESLLSFIREEFEYRPIYRSYLKEEIMERLEKEGYLVYGIEESAFNINESIYKHGFTLRDDEKEKVVLVIKESTNEREIHYAMDELTKTEKDLYFIAENQRTLLDHARKVVFTWVGNENPGLEKKMDLAIHFSTLQRIKAEGMWETADFSVIHNN